MKKSIRLWGTSFAALCALVLISTSAVLAFQVRPKTSRFDSKVVDNPTTSIDTVTTGLADLPATNSVRAGWEGFRVANGPWTVHLDRRSGAPLLVEGQGIRFAVEPGATIESIGTRLRSFMAANRSLLQAEDDELVLDYDGSGPLSPDVWQIVFNRVIAGVPVVGERYVFNVGHGNLISFGAPRWSRIDASPFPTIDSGEAIGRLTTHMGLAQADKYTLIDKGSLQLIPLKAMSMVGGPYNGPVGAGFTSALVWRIVLTVDGEPGTWEALVDAHTGAILSFNDINDYAQAKGGVYPVSNDGIPPDGVEQANWPMPYANISLGAQTTTSSGLFNCTPGGSVATTTLAGPYVKVVDTCGAVSASVTCDADLNLGNSAGTDCTTPGFGGAGNTHSSRTGFYQLNRIIEHARFWLPSRVWLTQQLTDNVNLNQTCNAYWNGSSVNFFKSGGGCRNTGEIAGVFLHEWGHGLDTNDGGGTMDNPSEAYADITALMSTHVSCVGRGFDMTSNCAGYGDACLNCTGIRDQDWDKHNSHTPATPSGFLTTFCGSGAGPCGKEVHCESYVSAETMWDLATRDLPAAGLDLASSWQLADRLWYKSRLGSGGNAYNCALPNSDGCAATSWFSKIRAVDDDDGNLANGTPHAAAIFAAFNRHKIACGLVGDASNQSTSTCPAIGATVLNSLAGSNSAILNWSAVANATAYYILRNDASCDAGSTVVATVSAPTTTYTDTGLANGFAEYYRVQAIGANLACDGLLSNCQNVTPQPYAGVVKLDKPAYSCSGLINVTVTDGNIPGTTATVKITSATEPGGETITVTQVGGSSDYVGTIATTSAPAAADGAISVVNGDTITATYIDADDGIGGTNITRTTSAAVDCVGPIISNVHLGGVGSNTAQILWDTNEPANSDVTFGTTPPPPGTTGPVNPMLTTSHSYTVTGLFTCSSYVFSVSSADAVGNLASDNNGGAYYTFTTGSDVTKNFPYAGPPVAIPDNNPAGGTATIAVPDGTVISDVNVTLNNVTHTYDSDVVVHLIGPDNTDVILANHRGSSGDNFTNTVFDDSAATPISAGVAPFTGSFIPDAPLSAFIGKIAAGTWKLFIVDSVGQDSGTITSWTLTLKLAQICAPHGTYGAHALVADTCSGGGAGSGNGAWETGEQVQFKVTASSDGTVTLTGVTATVVPITPGVTMLNGTASYPNIPGGTSADSIAPHFTAQLPSGLSCGSTVSFQLNINANEGSWSSSFSQPIGSFSTGSGNVLNESFSGGIPATWTVVDGGVGGAAAATWTTANPGARAIPAPMTAPVAIVDSDNAGNGAGILQDEQLITPLMNVSAAATVTLQFDQYFHWFSGGMDEIGDVDVRSTATGGAWVNVLRMQGAEGAIPDHRTINISAQAAGASDAQVRFHYYNAHWEWYWMVDNVQVDYSSPPTCSQVVCAAPAGVAKPVADGSFGTPMQGTRSDPSGTTIGLTWDVSTCSSTDHHVLYGDLANVSLSTVSGSFCNLGTSGSASWTGVPAGDLWFVVVGDDDVSKEGSWGLMTSGERGGASSSGQCGMTTRDNSGTCP